MSPACPLDMPSRDPEQWTYGSYVHCWLRARDMFRSIAWEQWTCPSRPGIRPRPLGMPAPSREQWTYGNYVHSRLPAFDMFRSSAWEQWTYSSLAASNGHVAAVSILGCDRWTCSRVLLPESGHVLRWSRGTCPPRPRPLDMPSHDREQWTCGDYVHSRPRARDMFQRPACEQWACSGVLQSNDGHVQREAVRAGHAQRTACLGGTSSARRRGSGCATDPRSAVRRRCGGIRRRRP